MTVAEMVVGHADETGAGIAAVADGYVVVAIADIGIGDGDIGRVAGIQAIGVAGVVRA